MTIPYTSIFDGPTIITRKDLCGILNLDISRPGLKFSAIEIQKSFKQRLLRFHPDKQSAQNPPIPTDICNILMSDILQARDYMLKGEDNIPGKACVGNIKKSFTMESNDWIDALISVLNWIQSETLAISSTIPWISRFSNNFFIILPLSTFSNNQLNFRYVNVFSKELDAIRPYLKDIDGSSLTIFLLQLKNALKSNEQVDIATIIKQLKGNLPEYLTENKKFDDLLAAIQGANKELKQILTNDFIGHLQHIVQFLISFIVTVPSWRHIVGVYFISLLFTASSVPRYFSATKTVTEVIWEQKGLIGLTLSSLPILILTAALLPLNIAIQLGIQFAWIAQRAFYQILVNSIKLLYSTINIARYLYRKDVSLSRSAFTLFESTLNITIRLAFNIAIEVLDTMIFVLTDQSMPNSFQRNFNNWLDSIINSLNPKIAEGLPLITANQDKIKEPLDHETPSQTFGFFDSGHAPFHNAEDIWLKQLLANLSVENQDDEVHGNPLKI
jgi:hypothetical protein